MPDIKTPGYIKALLKPSTPKSASRKVWSIDLERVWLPFFTATNVQDETAIPAEALGAPLRLAKDKDGSVKFSSNGRPVVRLAKELSDSVKMVRENFEASLVGYVGQVQKARPEDYKAQVQANREAGAPLNERAQLDVEEAVARAAALAACAKERERVQAEADKVVAEATA